MLDAKSKTREVIMLARLSLVAGACICALFAAQSAPHAHTAVALAGTVTSPEEGAMEGVLVSARKAGSNVTITVATDHEGRYNFPAAKLEPGQYGVRIRA